MASDWLGVNAPNISSGWHAPPQLQGRDLSGIVAATLRERLLREQQQSEAIANAIKNVRAERQSNEYLEAMKAAGLVPEDYEAGGVGGATLGTGLAKMIQNRAEADALERHRRAMEGFEGERIDIARERPPTARGAPRYPYTIPGTDETVELPASDYARRRAEDVTVGSYQGILKQEADAKAKMQELETKWGGAPGGKLKGAPAWPWQEDKTKEERIKDQILYNRAAQAYEMNRTQRENLENRKRGIVGGAPAMPDTDTGDTEDTTMPPGVTYVPGPSDEPNKPVTRGEKIDQATVAQYIKKAGRDTAVARKMAQEDGWTF